MYECLKDKDLGDMLFIPAVTLRHEGDLFLDDMSKVQLSEKLDVEIEALTNDGGEFVRCILGV